MHTEELKHYCASVAERYGPCQRTDLVELLHGRLNDVPKAPSYTSRDLYGLQYGLHAWISAGDYQKGSGAFQRPSPCR